MIGFSRHHVMLLFSCGGAAGKLKTCCQASLQMTWQQDGLCSASIQGVLLMKGFLQSG